jgi:DNA-binding CsgD family transcriptional regulator
MTVEQLRGLTGLSASQIGRLFGVSRRSVNNWLVGNPMAPHHQERLSELEETLMSVAGTTPEQRRAALLDSSRGTSLFHQLVGQVREDAVIHAAPLAAREQL